MIELQILGLLFGLFMIYLTFLYYKRGDYDITGFISWFIIWAIFLIVITFPEIFYGIMGTLNITRTADFLVSISLVVFFIMLFHIYAITKKTQKQMEKVVRKVAIEKKR